MTKISMVIALSAAAVGIGVGAAFAAFASTSNRSIGLVAIITGTSVIGTFWLAPTGALDTKFVKFVLWTLVGVGFVAAVIGSFVLVAGVAIALFVTLMVLAVVYRRGRA